MAQNPPSTINYRQIFIDTLSFRYPTHIPFAPGGGRESTLARWHKEGLPQDCADTTQYAYQQVGGTQKLPVRGPSFPFDERMIPQFEEKVIQRKERSQIVQDWKGNICEISNDYTIEYLRNAIDFVTRRWIKCPVETHDDWQNMKRRYDPDDPRRYPDNPVQLGRQLDQRDYPITVHFSGPFWILREWLGFENLCIMFHDNPAFVQEMIEFWTEFVAQMLRRILKYFTPDMFHISEDMAYKCFSMISPAMVRQFLLPTYKRWGQIIRDAKVPFFGIDSDGFIGELIPIWIEAGANQCDPVEVAAGNDIVAFRKQFGRSIAYGGGIDKRAIAAGGKTIEKEIQRVTPVIESGGYIPGCDHGVPADVSWPNFLHYTKLLAKKTGWL